MLLLHLLRHGGRVHLAGALRRLAVRVQGLGAAADGLEVLLARVQDGVDVGAALDGELDGALPRVQSDVHVDGAVGVPRLEEDALCLVDAPLEERELGLPPLARRDLAHARHVAELVDVLECGVGDLGRVQLVLLHRDGGEDAPERVVADEAAQADRADPVGLGERREEEARVRRDAEGEQRAVAAAADGGAGAKEVDDVVVAAEVVAAVLVAAHVLRVHQEVAVDEDGARVVPRDEAAVGDGGERLRAVVPRRAGHHGRELLRREPRVDRDEVQVAVAVDKGELAVLLRAVLRQRELQHVEVVRDLQVLDRPAVDGVEEDDALRVSGVADRARVVRQGHEVVGEQLGADRRADLDHGGLAALVAVHLDAEGAVGDEEAALALLDRDDDVAQVELHRLRPALDGVDGALRRGRDDEVGEADGDLDDGVAVLEHLGVLRRHVLDNELVAVRERAAEVAPVEDAVDELRKHEVAARRAHGDLRAVRRPVEGHHGPRVRHRLAALRPAGLVADAQGHEGADGEHLAVGAEAHGRDGVLARRAREERAAVGVPHAVRAVLAAGGDEVRHG
mmetsp:Transcript_10352/g.32055  ORF Transcript_10352/g.32055 Transcript_10352/m.32055 type:complete len:566 (-) Transcript_10352:659-2356(-)